MKGPPGTVEAGLEDRGVPEEEGGGGISVLSTLVAFRFGFGAISLQLQSGVLLPTILVFRHVKPSQQHDRFLPIVSALRDKRGMGIQQLPTSTTISIAPE